MYTMQQTLYMPHIKNVPIKVNMSSKQYVLGFRNQHLISVPNVTTSIKGKDNIKRMKDWRQKDPVLVQHIIAYHTTKTPLSQLLSLDVFEADLFIDVQYDMDIKPIHMYTALKYPISEKTGLILVQGATVSNSSVTKYQCWIIDPMKPSTLFHGGLLEML